MPARAMDSGASVAENTLAAFERGDSIVYPGRASVRVMAVAAQLLPHATVMKLAAGAFKKMGLHEPRRSSGTAPQVN